MANDRLDVLVVEDDPDYAEFLRTLLEEQGYGVVCTGAAREALRLLASTRVDLVITDVVMPDMDGIEFLRSFPSPVRGLPVIAITGSAMNAEGTLSRVMRALGATAVLAKPVANQDLLAAVRTALAGGPARPRPGARQFNQTA